MKKTTVAYIERDGRCLMLFRNKKKNDVNHGKWIGVGGKVEEGESPYDCIRREIFEETGLRAEEAEFCGTVEYVDTNIHEMMYVYHVSNAQGEVGSCNEGDLGWMTYEEFLRAPHWEGDESFLKDAFHGGYFGHYTCIYEDGILKDQTYEKEARDDGRRP